MSTRPSLLCAAWRARHVKLAILRVLARAVSGHSGKRLNARRTNARDSLDPRRRTLRARSSRRLRSSTHLAESAPCVSKPVRRRRSERTLTAAGSFCSAPCYPGAGASLDPAAQADAWPRHDVRPQRLAHLQVLSVKVPQELQESVLLLVETRLTPRSEAQPSQGPLDQSVPQGARQGDDDRAFWLAVGEANARRTRRSSLRSAATCRSSTTAS